MAPALMELSPVDQVMPRFYTRVILALPCPAPRLDDAAACLRRGLSATLTEIPFLRGHVVPSSRGIGLLDVQLPADDHRSGREELASGIWATKDLRAPASEGWILDMAELQASGFPTSRLPESVFAPLSAVPDPSQPVRVLVAQANLIPGGVLLCAAFHHSVLDANGFATVFRCWARHCRLDWSPSNHTGSEDRGPAVLEPGSFDRQGLADGAEGVQVEDLSEYMILPAPADPPAPPPSNPPTIPEMPVAIFRFSAEALQRLKSDVASSSLPSADLSVGRLSTNDCLCAFLWHSITLARYPRSVTTSTDADATTNSIPPKTSLGFAINGRSRTSPPMPATYLGTFVLYGTAAFALPDFHRITASSELQPVAAAIRNCISRVDAAHIRRVIGLVHTLSTPPADPVQRAEAERSPPLDRFYPSFQRFLGPDLAITSWAELGLVGLRFFDGEPGGEASDGVIAAVRLPMMEAPAFDGLVIILPKGSDAALDVMIGLEKSAMERLRENAENGKGLGAYGEFLCQ